MPALAVLLLLFVVVPLVELSILLRIGEDLGVAPTVSIVFLTGALGAMLARWQGVRTLRRIQEELAGDGRSELSIAVCLEDAEGKTVAEMDVDYAFRPREKR